MLHLDLLINKKEKYLHTSYLTKRALHPTQEVIITSANAMRAMNVIDLEAQLLHFLKVVI